METYDQAERQLSDHPHAEKAKTHNDINQELKAKAEKIIKLHEQLEDFTTRSEEAAKEAAIRAWDAGRLLTEVRKSLRHGQWLKWLKDQLPTLSRATVYRYLKVAEQFGTREEVMQALEEHGCLNGLYKAAGAIKSEDQSHDDQAGSEGTETDSEPAELDAVVQLQRTLRRLRNVGLEIGSLTDSLPPEAWTENEKAQLISSAKALLRIVHQKGWWEEIGDDVDPTQPEEDHDAES